MIKTSKDPDHSEKCKALFGGLCGVYFKNVKNSSATIKINLRRNSNAVFVLNR